MSRDLDEVCFLSDAALVLGEAGPEEDLFRFVAERLAAIVPDGVVLTASYDPGTGSFTIRAATGPEEMMRAGREVAGEPVGGTYRLDEQSRAILTEGKLVHAAGGMFQATFGSWSRELAARFEARLGIRAVFAQPFSRKGDLVGAVVLLSRSASLEHPGVIEVFIRLAAVAIQRQRAEARLREIDRRKDEFLAALSHELRNPLATIRNGIYVLGRAEPGGDQARRALAMMDRQIGQLARLIDDLLDVTRIARGKIVLRCERVDLNDLVAVTVEDHRSLFASAHVDVETFVAPAAVFVRADRARIRQILDNLLLNAAKFTTTGGRARISVGADAARKEAVLRVHNTGPPISPEVLAHLFQPFVQADQTLDRSKGGLGLGLALVKGLVDLHAGVVEVRSEGVGGTEFTVRLPLDTPLPAEPRPVPPTEPPRTGHRVLVIEDNDDVADSLREVLELEGDTVALARTGPEGIERARTFEPDVVLCDIGLPGMDGYEVAGIMRADPALSRLPLIALSGYASPEHVAKSRTAGFDRHVTKPPSVEVLEGAIAELAR